MLRKVKHMKKSTYYLGGAGLLAGAGALAFLWRSGKVSIPEGAEAVKPFDTNRYLGKWYKIARFDFKYENNLKNVTAEYSKNNNGSIRVVNRGYHTAKGEWRTAVGKAKPAGDKNEGRLKVSFFGPFYSGYNVLAIDPGYNHALVAGDDLDHLWILSREKQIPADVTNDFLKKARKLGYPTDDLVWTQQD